jgi:uncharacterized protein (TIGR02147 family)
MPTVFDVMDYRDLLHSYYEERKSQMPLYSYRMLGSKLGLDASQLFRILQKEQHLPSRCVPMAKDMLCLTGRPAEYFDLLIAASRSRSQQKKQELLDKAFALRDVRRHELSEKELQFLGQWWIATVRALLEVTRGNADPALIARSIIPPITEDQAREAIELLKDLGMVTRLPSEKLALAETHLTVSGPAKAQAVRQFQKQVMQLGANSLDTIPVEQRDISTLTMAVDEECLQELKEMAREFRRQVQKRVEECAGPDRIMHLNMALFPVAQKQEART